MSAPNETQQTPGLHLHTTFALPPPSSSSQYHHHHHTPKPTPKRTTLLTPSTSPTISPLSSTTTSPTSSPISNPESISSASDASLYTTASPPPFAFHRLHFPSSPGNGGNTTPRTEATSINKPPQYKYNLNPPSKQPDLTTPPLSPHLVPFNPAPRTPTQQAQAQAQHEHEHEQTHTPVPATSLLSLSPSLSLSLSRSPSPSPSLSLTLNQQQQQLRPRLLSKAEKEVLEEQGRAAGDAVERVGLGMLEPRPVPLPCTVAAGGIGIGGMIGSGMGRGVVAFEGIEEVLAG
ncbi:hypothetical protein BO82DRAFT_397108 [Aspergillus uvarum CBS 121591]|uniref:Uncharacterized protein n=1 Tax=Aspergillus uvarum CBS 121591 TaxID=1448315 RepID=A0A319CXP1_9EURO|nr:hypothetical protein BO82DRAFT_397108 [Aspergillus uvarum CBS 121591]PYH87187.1 hypothetical protein BO82DRAFT_397108 [Aspergillus uvarum CBS 121591]